MLDFTKRHIFEGSMGTMLQGKGLAAGEVPEEWNITNRQVVLEIHKAYKDAGANIAKTNTFGANRLKLAESAYSVRDLVAAGVEIAKEANNLVALSVGPTGKLLAPLGDLDFEEAIGIFSETMEAGVRSGADIILIETFSDVYEIKAAMLAAKEYGLPVFVTFTVDENGRLLTGADVLTALCLIEGLGAAALGFNCGLGPTQMKKFLPELYKYSSTPLILNPNAGMPELVNGNTVFKVGPSEFADKLKKCVDGVFVVGGCCGTTPNHIGELVKSCCEVPYIPPKYKEYTAVSSYSKTVMFGGKTVIIGERLNPTGKPRLKMALKENDMGYVFNEGISQTECGADILDVNVGMPGIDEKTKLPQVVKELQTVTDAPLQIDTSDPQAAENALRLYRGKPLLNSVSGKEENLTKILPLVKKYGAVVVALTLDDRGIPATAEERLEVAKKIFERAKEYGIPKKNIIIDPLALTISTGGKNADVTLKTLELLKGHHTVLGVSNVSFGLPQRQEVNRTFFALAMNRGLSAAIIDPKSQVMMDAFYAYNALSGFDVNAESYIGRFGINHQSGRKSPPAEHPVPETGGEYKAKPVKTRELHDAVIRGLKDQAGLSTRELLKTTEPMEIINTHLIPALKEVGENYEKQAIYLPQLLMSAEAAKSAFESIKHHMSKTGSSHKKRGKVILATVKGDVHDIGKNIVKALLENFNFDVVDLGKNVEPGLVAKTAKEQEINIVGLSALMTTTLAAMEETIRLVRESVPSCKIMVGGAVLTEEFAENIGADYFAKDAMSGVKYAESLVNRKRGV